MEDGERINLSERRLVIEDLLERHDESVGETASSVNVGVGSGSDSPEDLVLGDYLRPGMDTPTARRLFIHLSYYGVVFLLTIFPGLMLMMIIT